MPDKFSVGAPTQYQPCADRTPTKWDDAPVHKIESRSHQTQKSPLAAGLFSMEIRCQVPTRIVTTREGSSM